MAGFLVAPVTWSSNISPLSFSMAVCLLSHFSCVRPFATPWTVARPAPLSMGFSRQEYWSGLPFPPSGDLSDPGIEPVSPVSPAFAGGFFTTELPGKPLLIVILCLFFYWLSVFFFLNYRHSFLYVLPVSSYTAPFTSGSKEEPKKRGSQRVFLSRILR